MADPFSDRALLSRPFPVEWAGFRSDTFTLQRCGWKLAAQRSSFDYGRFGRMELLGECNGVRFMAEAQLDLMHRAYLQPDFPNARLPVFCVRRIAHELEMQCMRAVEGGNYWRDNFEAVDARPQWVSRDRLGEAQLFAPANTAAEEIFVREADLTVLEHLEAIKKLQAPIQREIRENDRRYEWRGKQANAAPDSKLLANVVQLRAR